MRTFTLPCMVLALVLTAVETGTCQDGGWNRFRGPNGSGHAVGATPPVALADEHIAWKTAIPAGHSSPVLIHDHIYCTAVEDGRLVTLAVNRHTGEPVWKQAAPPVPLEETHKVGNPAAPTPYAHEDGVIVYFGSYGLIAYSHEGVERWSIPIPRPQNMYGMATSPIGYGDLVILTLDTDERIADTQMTASKLVAYSVKRGEVVWETPRPFFSASWTTPMLWDQGDRTDLVLLGAGRVAGYDPDTGIERWYVNGFSRETLQVPVLGDGRLYIGSPRLGGVADESPDPERYWNSLLQFDSSGDGAIQREEMTDAFRFPLRPELPIDNPGYGFPFFLPDTPEERAETFDRLMEWQDKDSDGYITKAEYTEDFSAGGGNRPLLLAILPGGNGNITDSHVAWEVNRNVPEIPSPLYHDGRLYLVRDGGLLACLNAQSGETLYRGRIGAMGMYSAGPVMASGHLYTVSNNGVISVIAPGNELNVVHQYDVEEQVYATPAIDTNTLYVRTTGHLIAFRKDD